jgi:nucleotide-binding universal stress UspA family protein
MSETEPPAEPLPKGAIVVGVDGSETAERALAWAARHADLEGKTLVIAYALGFIGTPEAAGLAFDGGPSFAIIYEQLQAGGEELVAAATARVAESHPTVAVRTVVEDMDARQLLLRLAQNASLVVMGSRGRGALRSLFLGSVTAGVAGRAECPVVVIPARDEAGGAAPAESSR